MNGAAHARQASASNAINRVGQQIVFWCVDVFPRERLSGTAEGSSAYAQVERDCRLRRTQAARFLPKRAGFFEGEGVYSLVDTERIRRTLRSQQIDMPMSISSRERLSAMAERSSVVGPPVWYQALRGRRGRAGSGWAATRSPTWIAARAARVITTPAGTRVPSIAGEPTPPVFPGFGKAATRVESPQRKQPWGTP